LHLPVDGVASSVFHQQIHVVDAIIFTPVKVTITFPVAIFQVDFVEHNMYVTLLFLIYAVDPA
jgi:hypothetical protein